MTVGLFNEILNSNPDHLLIWSSILLLISISEKSGFPANSSYSLSHSKNCFVVNVFLLLLRSHWKLVLANWKSNLNPFVNNCAILKDFHQNYYTPYSNGNFLLEKNYMKWRDLFLSYKPGVSARASIYLSL